jgi:Bacterial regulatory protein, Fis family
MRDASRNAARRVRMNARRRGPSLRLPLARQRQATSEHAQGVARFTPARRDFCQGPPGQDPRHASGNCGVIRFAEERDLTPAELERDYIFEVLRRATENKTRAAAAEILGIPRRILYRRPSMSTPRTPPLPRASQPALETEAPSGKGCTCEPTARPDMFYERQRRHSHGFRAGVGDQSDEAGVAHPAPESSHALSCLRH